MRKVPSCMQYMFFAPATVGLLFLLKTFCPASAGTMCFSDQFSSIIFLPLNAVYQLFGDSSIIYHQEFLFILIYWASVGFLIGLIIDIWPRRDPRIAPSQYLPESHLPPSQTSVPVPPLQSQASRTS